jgi:AcrR family transcriptional regulator
VREFVRHGVAGTSIERVAAGAGYTRGAFYAHFRGKEEICLALLEERFDRYLEAFEDVLAGGDEPEVRARRAGDHLSALTAADPAAQRLLFELSAFALRHERFRRELAKRYEALRQGVAEVFRVRAHEFGVASPIPFDRLALMTFAMSTGVGTVGLVEPGRVPEELHGEMLAIFFAGLRALAEGAEGS